MIKKRRRQRANLRRSSSENFGQKLGWLVQKVLAKRRTLAARRQGLRRVGKP